MQLFLKLSDTILYINGFCAGNSAMYLSEIDIYIWNKILGVCNTSALQPYSDYSYQPPAVNDSKIVR